MVFSPNMVHILPGYSKRSPEDPKVAMIALYLSLPSEVSQGTVLSQDILSTVIKSIMPNIGRSMDGSIVSVYPLSSPVGEFQTNDNKSEANLVPRSPSVTGNVRSGKVRQYTIFHWPLKKGCGNAIYAPIGLFRGARNEGLVSASSCAVLNKYQLCGGKFCFF